MATPRLFDGASTASRSVILSLPMPDRRWNRSDFELVIRSHALPEEALAQLLPKRRKAEVRRLREVLHVYHVSGRYFVPDDSMAAHLAGAKGELMCASCGERY
jgi:hypothetical protein